MTDTADKKQQEIPRVAYRVETERLVMRCWSPADAADLRAALDESDQHLRPWIPFMKDEPRTLQQTVHWLRKIRAAFDRDENYQYAIYRKDTGEFVGDVMLMRRAGKGALEVGYWITLSQGGHGFATEASEAALRVAFELDGADRVELHCSPQNAPSRAIPVKLGFIHEASLRRRFVDAQGDRHDSMVWTMFADDYARSAISQRQVEAYDALGDRIL